MSAPTSSDADPWTDLNFDDPDLQRLLDEPLALNTSVLREDEHFVGFDNNVGDTWIYPNNMPLRCYQHNISQAALFRNTLVVLPTGLGKTFIAAVVMYNYYRWYPTGKVIFMAPTRPLVAQQIEACQKIMPLPNRDTVELTGRLNKRARLEQWQAKRVFFATPQVVQSDIMSAPEDGSRAFPFDQVKLIVVDEAHKARGRYAYCEVAQALWQHNRFFRVLALSATPGRNMEDVAEVVRNLFISHLEVRCDTSIDVSPYVHKRSMKTVVVPLSAEIEAIRGELLAIIDPYLRQLIDADVLGGSLTNINRNWLLYEQKRFRDRSLHQQHPQQSAVTTNFSVCISLYHALELLERHGLRVFLNNFEQDEEGRCKFVMAMDRKLRNLVERLRREMGPNPFDVSAHMMTNGHIADIPKDLDFGHPKFEKARSCLLEHFEANPDSRAIVFCEYRESVMLIYRLLLQHRPLLQPRCFIGQGTNAGGMRPLTQKQQIQVMSDFRSGASNILIATSIGEEGIDVGEVNLIVCFDISTTNPTRFVQRIGRTGRQKQGHVVMLVTAGREQALLKDVLSNKDQTNKKLARSTVIQGALYKNAPRMVPPEFNPKCLKTFVTPPVDESPAKKPKKAVAAKERSTKAASKGTQDLRKFFKKTVELDAEDLEVFADDSRKSSREHSFSTDHSASKSLSKISNYFEKLDFSDIIASNTQLLDSGTADVKPVEAKMDEKYVRKLNKFLKNATIPEPSPPLKPMTDEEFLAQLKSPKLLPISKLLLLKMNSRFVRQTLEQMKVLLALDVEDGIEMSLEEQEIRTTYELMVSLFGGREAMEKFLDDMEMQEFKWKCSVPEGVDDSNDFSIERIDRLFEGLDDRGFCCDNFDFIEEEFKKTDRYKELMNASAGPAELAAESMVYETIQQSSDFSTHDTDDPHGDNISITDSKYCSQWNDFVKKDLTHKSTPVQGLLDKVFQRQAAGRTTTKKTANLIDKFEAARQREEAVIEEASEERSISPIAKAPASIPKITETLDDSTPDFLELPATASNSTQVDSFAKPADVSTSSDVSKATDDPLVRSMLDDIDLDVFLEPFPEEEILNDSAHRPKPEPPSRRCSLKENLECNNNNKLLSPAAPAMTRKSPDLFETEREPSPLKANNKMTLAAKLAAKRIPNKDLISPVRPKAAPAKDNDRSPSIFDIYMRNMQRLSRMQKTSPLAKMAREEPPKEQDETVIGLKRKTSKRKIFDSDSEEEANQTAIEVHDSETSCEEIAPTQQLGRKAQPRKRQRRHCSFIEVEAGVSGSDVSEDEADFTLGHYVHDSVIVPNDEAEDDASTSHMQAMYLQSLKSPRNPRGAFKIPAFRKFNDHSKIFSQAVPVESSQYEKDSFVVSEGEGEDEAGRDEDAEESVCPLERAERILRERRRAKRLGKVVESPAQRRKKRKICHIVDSSDDDFE